jgi:hypothetical protein
MAGTGGASTGGSDIGSTGGTPGQAGADGEAGAGGTLGDGGADNTSGDTSTGGTSSGGASTGGKSSGGASSGGASSGGAASGGASTGGKSSGGAGGSGGCTSLCNENGTACTTSNQCKSGRCVDGVCCNVQCDGPCEACSATLTGAADGLCSAVKTGTDPGNDCAAEAISSCGQTGLCGPNRTCALYGTTSVCAAGSCSAGAAQSERKCDGAGTCRPATSSTCAPYVCGANACLSACTTNNNCASGSVCIAGTCRAPSGLLGACDEDADCSRGQCLTGVCALYVTSIRITGTAVSGGGSQIFMDGWFKSNASGGNLVRLSTFPFTQYLHNALDVSSPLSPKLAPNSYVLLTGSEGSNALTRTFQFNLSDGSSVTKSVQVASSANILLVPEATVGSGDPYVLFQFTGADVNVLSKTY